MMERKRNARRWRIWILAALCMLMLGACGRHGAVKILHCDRCGRELEYPADTNLTDDWIIVCSECRKNMD